jgi:hypothetical protein
MLCVKSGATRTVILIGNWAIKLPFTFSNNLPYRGFWYRFLHGLLSNMQEKEFSHVKYLIPLLPINFYIWGGFMNIMKRGIPITNKEFEHIQTLSHLLPPIVEMKQDSFVKVDGVIYVCDYGS